MIDTKYELDQLDQNPEWFTVLETYSRAAEEAKAASKAAEKEFSGWVARVRDFESLEPEELSFIHGKLIALGFLKFQIADRTCGMQYRLSSLGVQALNRGLVAATIMEVESSTFAGLESSLPGEDNGIAAEPVEAISTEESNDTLAVSAGEESETIPETVVDTVEATVSDDSDMESAMSEVADEEAERLDQIEDEPVAADSVAKSEVQSSDVATIEMIVESTDQIVSEADDITSDVTESATEGEEPEEAEATEQAEDEVCEDDASEEVAEENATEEVAEVVAENVEQPVKPLALLEMSVLASDSPSKDESTETQTDVELTEDTNQLRKSA